MDNYTVIGIQSNAIVLFNAILRKAVVYFISTVSHEISICDFQFNQVCVNVQHGVLFNVILLRVMVYITFQLYVLCIQ